MKTKRPYGGRKSIPDMDKKQAISIYLTGNEINILGGKESVRQIVSDHLKNNLLNNLHN